MSSRPTKLDDRDWLKRQYATHGDSEIASHLGCATATVRRARLRLNIPSKRPGRERRLHVATSADRPSELSLLADRFHADQMHHVPATREHLIACCQGWLDAERHHDQPATEDALLSIASAAMLVHEHQVKLRKAA